jgi:hypothetical protein
MIRAKMNLEATAVKNLVNSEVQAWRTARIPPLSILG